MFSKLNPVSHMVVDTPVARYLQRKTGNPNLFTYFDKNAEKYVAATWINKNGRICHEHFVWDGGPNDCREEDILGFMITQSDEYRSFLREKAVQCRLSEKHLDDEAISYAEQQAEIFDYHKRHARATLQDHPSWWHFPKQDRRVG